jgi:hypothetical protein
MSDSLNSKVRHRLELRWVIHMERGSLGWACGSGRLAPPQRVSIAALVSVLAFGLAWPSLSAAVPVNGGELKSGHPVAGEVIQAEGIAYTFTAVAGQHVTLAITDPHNVSPSGSNLVMRVYDSGKAEDASSRTFSTSGTEIDFTPTKEEEGPTTVVISDYENPKTTGSFTLTYATDVTGALTPGVPVNGAIEYAGQHADYSFTAVAGRHVTFALSNPNAISPAGSNLVMRVYDKSGAEDASSRTFSTTGTEIDFTPTKEQEGPSAVVIEYYENPETTGEFTLTYATDVTSALTPGVPVNGAIEYAGQHADYSFTAVAGQVSKLTIGNPSVSPVGSNLVMRVYDASGAEDTSSRTFSASGAELEFTPTKEQEGPTTVVIEYYENPESTGSFTLTYDAVVAGSAPHSSPQPSGPPAKSTPARARSAGEIEAALATAFGLPPARACYSRRAFAIHIRQPHGYPRIVSAEVFLDKWRERTLGKKGLVDKVVLRGLPRGTFTIRIVARTVTGQTLAGTRTYHTCRSKLLKGGAPKL